MASVKSRKIDKPIISFMTNVFWDAQLNYPNSIFDDMKNCIFETVDFFIKHKKDLCLIIRVHPGEIINDRPSNQKMSDEIKKEFKQLPDNIHIIEPESPLSSYSIGEKSNAIIVYGSKIGSEMAALGKKVIVAGEAWVKNKGISMDPSTKEEYFNILKSLPFKNDLDEESLKRAKKYAYHFFFRKMIQIKCLKYNKSIYPPFEIKTDIYKLIMENDDKGMNAILDKILNNKEIIFSDENYLN